MTSFLEEEGAETGRKPKDIDSWLKEKGLEHIGDKFKQCGLTLNDILHCSEQDIRYELVKYHYS